MIPVTTGGSRLIRNSKSDFLLDEPNFELGKQISIAEIGEKFASDFVLCRIRIIQIRINWDPHVRVPSFPPNTTSWFLRIVRHYAQYSKLFVREGLPSRSARVLFCRIMQEGLFYLRSRLIRKWKIWNPGKIKVLYKSHADHSFLHRGGSRILVRGAQQSFDPKGALSPKLAQTWLFP